MILLLMGIPALLILILGVRIRNGKNIELLSIYRFIPKSERHKLNNSVISRSSGNMMIRIAIALLLMGAAIYFEKVWPAIILLTYIIIDPCITTIRLYRMNSAVKAFRTSAVIIVVVTLITFVGIGYIFIYGERDPEVIIADNTIQIKSMYGMKVNIEDIQDISLIEKSMGEIGVTFRNNGYGGFGGTLKGHFTSADDERIMLFVKAGSTPTIWIDMTDQKDIYISYNNSEKTRKLYQTLEKLLVRD